MTPKRVAGRRKKVKVSKGMKEWIKAFLYAFVFLVLLRFFVFDLKSLSDSSMEKTLLSGDVLLVNKFNYGARMPMRILPHAIVRLFFTTDSLTPVKQLPYWRLPGNRDPQYNDLVYLNIPAPHSRAIDQRTRIVRRLAGLPGDDLMIRNAEVFINGKRIPQPADLQWNYLVETKRNIALDEFLEAYQIREGHKKNGRNSYLFPLTASVADSISQRKDVKKIQRFPGQQEQEYLVPFGQRSQQWDADNFGPVRIPGKGYTVPLNPRTIDLWYYHIVFHEREAVTIVNDSVFINGSFVQNYTFKNDYYFLLGDNRHNTSDSRLWGMVPENHIVGRANLVLASFDKEGGFFDKIRWTRFFSRPGRED
ncbi:MAG: signal peptidase I [Bacteroidota bacterium]